MKKIINNSFQFFLTLSLLFHLGIIIVFVFSKALPNWIKKEKKVLIQSSIRVDTIALPDLPSTKKIKAKKQKTVLVKEKKKEKQEKKKRKARKEKKTKKERKEKKIQKQQEKENLSKTELKNENSSKKSDKLKKGNKISKGTGKGKETLSDQQLEGVHIYMNQVIHQIKIRWESLPKYLADKNLTAQVEIKINEKGQIIYKKTLISSGNEEFDSFVLQAIEDSGPYPPPPLDIQDLIKGGIVSTLNSKD